MICSTFLATAGNAAVVEINLGWEPSPQTTITGYEIHVGATSGSYDEHIDAGMPNLDSTTLRSQIGVDDSRNNFISISGYDAMGSRTAYSQEFLLLAVVVEPEPEPEPEPAPEPVPEPTPTPEPGPEVFDLVHEAAIAAILGLGGEVGAYKPIDGVPAAFARSRKIKKYIAYGSEYVLCDLEGDGLTDLVLGNLFSGIDSARKKGEPGQIIIFDRHADVYGVVSINTRKQRADFLDGHTGYVETHVACGDIDGDGLQELIVSSGSGGGNRLQILDDIHTGFAPFEVPGSSAGVLKVAADILQFGGNGELLTSVGDFDGDGANEVAVGFKHPAADQILILNGAAGGFAPMEHSALDAGYLVTTHEGKANFQGIVAPVAIDFDRDGIDEIVGVYASDGEIEVEMFDDAHTGFHNLTQ